jgi:hypothetical protein
MIDLALSDRAGSLTFQGDTRLPRITGQHGIIHLQDLRPGNLLPATSRQIYDVAIRPNFVVSAGVISDDHGDIMRVCTKRLPRVHANTIEAQLPF